MGSSPSAQEITAEQLEEYASLLYLHKSDILEVYRRLKKAVPDVMTDRNLRFNPETLQNIFPELKWNPFFRRIVSIFSSQRDDCLSFEDILDLYSALSPNCPIQVKAEWAFRIFDYDGDGEIGPADIKDVIEALVEGTDKETRNLQDREKDEIAKSILADLDLDGTGGITAAEFAHAVLKIPEFTHAFRVRV